MDNICIIDTAASIRFPALVLIISGECAYSLYAHNSFYYFRMVVTCTTFGFLIVTAFLESSNMLTADYIRGETIIVVNG